MLTRENAATALETLRSAIQGAAVAPGDEGWDDARRAWNLAVDQRPALVALPETAGDVALVVDFAREQGLRVAVQGTGHSAAPRGGDLEDAVLLNMVRMKAIEIDPEARIARVEAGVLWGEVAAAAAGLGLAGLSGSSADVGVVGYTLGGGMGWLGRRYGFASNSVRAIELVTAAGEIVRVDRETEPDLFWALRGGGGSFAAVTALELDLHPVGELYAGTLYWPIERAQEVLHRYVGWARTVPDELTSVGRIFHFPSLPFIPEPVRGRSFVVVEAAFLGSEADGAELVAPLREIPGVVVDTFAVIAPAELSKLHNDPEGPVPGFGDGFLLGEVTPAAVEALVVSAGDRDVSPLVSVEIRHLGGALGRPAPGHGALAAVDAEYALFAVGMAPSPELGRAVERHLVALAAALEPWATGRSYLNFAERPGAPRSAFDEGTYARLAQVKAAYDPENVFRANHPIDPAS